MKVLGHGLPSQHGRKVGGVGALLLKKKFAFLFREGPHFDLPLFLQITKGTFPAGCRWSVQGWSNEY